MEFYLSYVSSDSEHGARLIKDLRPAARQLGCSIWSMQDIIPGGQWRLIMAEHLREARFFVPLISADFLANDRCNAETQGAIALESRGQLKIIPILLSPCLWEYSSLAEFPVLPENGREVTTWSNRDSAWRSIQKSLLTIAQSFLLEQR